MQLSPKTGQGNKVHVNLVVGFSESLSFLVFLLFPIHETIEMEINSRICYYYLILTIH